MVMGFGNKYDVLQETINILDDIDIDFFIHWDKRFPLPKLYSNHSRIIYIPRIKVRWATDLQTKAQILLMNSVINNNLDIKYGYCHLISSNDIPLMDKNYFKNYFKEGSYYLGFFDYLNDYEYKKMKYYYPIRYFNIKNNLTGYILIRLFTLLNKIFHINRINRNCIEKGVNWYSLDIKYIEEVMKKDNFQIFKNTISSDEFYMQTSLKKLKPKDETNIYDYYSDKYRLTESSKLSSRYIDFYRGTPYVFSMSDLDELRQNINSKYAFARKVYDKDVPLRLFNNHI